MVDKVYVLENTLRYLRFFLIWPEKGESNFGIVFYFKFILLMGSTSFVLFGSLAHMVVALYENNGAPIDLDIAVIISLVGTYYFNISYLSKVKEIVKIFKDFTDFSTFELPPEYNKFTMKWNKLSVFHFIYYVFIVSACFLTPLLETKKCLETNIVQNLNEVCGLVMNVWLPVDFDYFPLKQMMYSYQVYSAFFSYVVSSTISFSIMESVEHLIFRLEHVKELFVKALRQSDRGLRKELFNQSVQYHNFIISLVRRLNKCYSPCIFVHLLFTGAILGCVGFQLTQNPHLVTVELFIGWYLSLIMVASGGQRLIDKSISIGDAIYHTRWYDVDIEIQKNIILVLARCQDPILLEAGSFGFMSFQMVLMILKTSYSIITLMKGTSLSPNQQNE